MQCRRLPNRDGSQCAAVPYLIDSDCDGGECSVDFVHADQAGVDRADFAFVCEVWWPEKPGNFEGGPLLAKTEIFWGDAASPQKGDVPVDYCPGITPIFSAERVDEPNDATECGTALNYLLSVPETSGAEPVDGGTVTTNVAPGATMWPRCSLLEAYDDVLVPDGFGDQCTSGNCPRGRQIACLIDSRVSQIEDPAAVCLDGSDQVVACDSGTAVKIDSATSLYRNYELIFIQGDLRMRRN
jgi:hypothetical protein